MATTVNLGKLRFDFRGDYSNTSAYVANDVVCFRGAQYICIANTTAGTAPSNATFWSVFANFFNNRGTWASGQTYSAGDIVLYSTPGVLSPTNTNFTLSRSVVQAYHCINNHTSSGTITPIDTGFWIPINRRGVLGTQSSVGATTGAYSLGVYSNSNYGCLVFPNRGIAFDSQSNYRGGGYKNTTDCQASGVVTTNGQVVSFGTDVNGSVGMTGFASYQQNALTFPFYDWYRSITNGGSGVHTTPDGSFPRVIQWEKSSSGNCVLMNSGEVFAWGFGTNGENGNGQNANYNYPVRVGGTQTSVYNNASYVLATNGAGGGHAFGATRIKRIAMSGGCGYPDDPRHTLALDENGFVWSWGFNAYGQLGNNTTTSYNVPQRLDRSLFGNQAVIAIWAFGNRTGWSMAVTADNSLWVWGYNVNGQLGVGDNSNRLIPTQITAPVNFGSNAVGNIVKVQGLDRWDGSSAGQGCTAILTSRGFIYVTGRNGSGWMGNSNTSNLNTWTNVGSGVGQTSVGTAFDMWMYGTGGDRATLMVRDTNGICYTAGYNARGQLGLGGTSTLSSNVFVNTRILIAGNLSNLTNVRQLGFVGQDDTLSAAVVLDSGLAFSIGDNTQAQLSNGVDTGAALGSTTVDANGIENSGSNGWQPVRCPPGMIGRFDDVIGYGNSSGLHLMWKNQDGRWMVSGQSTDAGTGVYAQTIDTRPASIMTTIVVD